MTTEILSYASADELGTNGGMDEVYPVLSIGTAALPFVGLYFASGLPLMLGIPLTPLGFIIALTAIIRGRGSARVLGVIGAIAALPGLYWYYHFLFVGIC